MVDIWDQKPEDRKPKIEEKERTTEPPKIHWEDKPFNDLSNRNSIAHKLQLEAQVKSKFKHLTRVSSSICSKVLSKGEEIDFCPAKVRAYILEGKDEFSTDSMEKGNFYESLLLGSSRDGTKVLQLERKKVSDKAKREATKKGLPPPEPEMRVDEIRIRTQAQMSEIKLFNHKVQIVKEFNTQVPVFKIWNGIFLEAHLDIFPTPLCLDLDKPDDIRIACIDTKLTIDLDSTFPPFCWGKPEEIDITQALMYYFMLEDIDYSINPYLLLINQKERQFPDVQFAYFVAEYRSDERMKSEFFPVRKTDMRMNEIKEIIRKTASIIEQHNETGWPENPSYNKCKNCPLNPSNNGKCTKAINTNVI